MNEHETERIAAAMNQLRPDWPIAQLRTLLRDDRITTRPRRDVTVALAWVACESGTASPYRVLEAGPWWRAAGTEGSSGGRREWPDDAHRCGICSLHRDECRARWHDDHAFRPANEQPTLDVARIVAELRSAKAEPVEHHPDHEPTTEGTEHVAPIRAALAAAKADTEETT